MVFRVLQAEGNAVRAYGDAIDTQQASAWGDPEQFCLGGRCIDDFYEGISARRVDALRFGASQIDLRPGLLLGQSSVSTLCEVL